MLTGCRLVSLIVYVNDMTESREFYEARLGLRVIECSEESVTFDAGEIALRLKRAADHGVTLAGRRDDSSDIVFLVDDLQSMRLALQSRGVEFVRSRSYEVGLVTDFYDPNGHRLMLYEPSEVALTWPSGGTIRDLWRSSGHGGSGLIGPPKESLAPEALPVVGLDGKPLTYLFMFEDDSVKAFDFYRELLGLEVIERVHCCNQSCPEEVEGIVKYDGGSVLLATHHVHEDGVVTDDFGTPYSPREYRPEHAAGIAPVFEVPQVAGLRSELSRRGVRFESVAYRGPGEPPARFTDPFGHPFFLCEPAVEVASTPGGPAGERVSAG